MSEESSRGEIVMRQADVRVLLYHLAFYGLAAMLDDAGVPDVRLSWTSGMQPRPRVTGAGLSVEVVDEVVREHARARVAESSWVQRDVELGGTLRGLMSPRLTSFVEDAVWQRVQAARHRELDVLTAGLAWSDLRFLAALGEPCYWSRSRKDEVLQDDGASRLEMQPRNQGSEFVRTRLRRLAAAVEARGPGAVAAGILGDITGAVQLGAGNPTGFAGGGSADDAVMWCATWGVAQLPTTARVNATALTSGHLGRSRQEWFYVPVWEPGWRPARLRSVLASRKLRDAAAGGLPAPWAAEPAREVASRAWLAVRGVVGTVRFPIQRFGSDSAPERRAMRGEDRRTAVP